MSRVRIGTCSSPADAALVRSLFSAHGIAVVIGAEHHANLLGPLGGSFLSLDIWVDEADGDEGVALLRDLRERDERSTDEDEVGQGGEDGDAGRSDSGDDPGSSVSLRIDQRRRTGIVLLLGCIVTFGTAHMFTRAWLRGFALAAIEIAGIMHLWHGRSIGGGVVAAAILSDLIGALRRVRTAPRSELPTARLHGG